VLVIIQNVRFCSEELITAPKILTATMLTFFKTTNVNISKPSAIVPDGKEYSIAETLPANKLPRVVFKTSVINAYHGPNNIKDKSMNILDIPMRAPGKNKGGNKFSITNETIASAENIPQSANLNERDLIISLHPQ